MNRETFARYFQGGTWTEPDFSAEFQTRELAPLSLPTGRIVAADVVEGAQTQPYLRPVNPGTYPVFVSIAHFSTDSDQRVAAAMIRFSDALPQTFELARLDGAQDASFSVDSALGCYLDESALRFLEAMSDQQDQALVAELDRQFAEHQTDTWSWTNLALDPEQGLNVIAFSTGWGDEDYFSYFGFAEPGGPPVCLVTDFRLLD
jgi:hypothetical protein